MLYQFHTSMTEQDYYDFNIYHLEHTPQMKKELFRQRLILPVTFAVLMLLYWLVGESSDLLLIKAIFFGIASLIWFFSAKALSIFLLKRQLKRMKKGDGLPFSPEATMEFYDEHFCEITETDKTEIQYSGITRFCKSKTMLLLYKNIATAYMIPLSVFESEAQQKEFTEFICAKTNLVLE